MRNSRFSDMQHEWYASNRYLSHLSDDELFERLRHVMGAWLNLNRDGQISFGNPNVDERNLKLIAMLTHTQAEVWTRRIEEPKGLFDAAGIPHARLADSGKLKRIESLASQYKGCLFKFGQSEYLNRRSFKISLASTFNDESLHPAQRDDELKRKYKPHPTLGFSPFRKQAYEQVLMDRYRVESDFDYYVLCLSTNFSLRMFDDFGSDAVMIIKDRKALQKALTRRMKQKVSLSNLLSAPVSYYDDVRDIPRDSSPPELTKHFRFFYQKEYRMAFLPKRIERDLDLHLFLELPELEPVTEVITLD